MNERRFTRAHQWIAPAGDGTARVGITDYAQNQLGDVVYVDLPALGKSARGGDLLCTVESVKTASDVFMPVAGTVVGVNERLRDHPELVNSGPYTDGWFVTVRIDDAVELDALLDEPAYAQYVSGLG